LRLDKVVTGRVTALSEAVIASLPELEQFMDWARPETSTAAHFHEFVARSLQEWETDKSHTFHVIERATDELVGGCALVRRVGPGAIEIGYWIRSDRTGRGYATEAARACVEAAWTLPDIGRVEIRFDAANVASARVAEKVGATEIERRDVEIDNPGEIGIEVITQVVRPAHS
jgi:RimJ/RimL family protein N-acetyltransferase